MSWPLALPPWYELGEAIAAAVLCLLTSVRVWAVVGRPSRIATVLRPALTRRGTGNVFWAVVALCALFIVAEEVPDRGPEEVLPDVDLIVRDVSQAFASWPVVRKAARGLSDVTGLGLVIAVLSIGVALAVLRHRRDALILVVGSLSAWALSGVLKAGLGVPRPHSPNGGFPSGHVLVTVVACGLIAWSLGRFAHPRARRMLYSAAVAIALLSAMARLILDLHWFSDVVGGLAAGTVWLNVVILTARRLTPPTGSPNTG